MNILQSTLSSIRDHYSFVSNTSNFRATGQITPEEFVLAGDYLVYKFPTWSWADASPESKRVAYLPAGKQYLVTRGVPCHRRLDENFAGQAGVADDLVQDGFLGPDEGEKSAGGGDGEDDGWLRTGGSSEKEQAAKIRDVQTMSESGNLGEKEADDDDEIPDMEDEDDDNEAIIRDPKASGTNAPLRTYNLYITYFPYYRTPRLYLSGYLSASEPLPPQAMMEDIVGDYKDKTVTLETFPFFDGGLKMASVHPCKHASVMKVLLDRADAALRLRLLKLKKAEATGGKGPSQVVSGMEGLIDDTSKLSLEKKAHAQGVAAAGGAGGDEWEVLDQEEGEGEDKVAIRVDQYLVVFLKFIASLAPAIEHDFTMGV